MRLLHVARDYHPDVSGVAEVAFQLTTELARRGHEVWVATGPQLNSAATEQAPGVRVKRFGVTGNISIGIRGDAAAYVDFVLGTDWDAVTIHSVTSWPIELLLPHLRNLLGATLVVNHSDAELRMPHRRTYRRELGHALRNVDRTIVLSSSLVDRAFYREFNLPSPVIISNGVDLKQWASPPIGVRTAWGIGRRPWLVSVSNHSGVKRHDRFFEVMRRVKRVVPEATGTLIGHSHRAEKFGLGRLGIRGGCWYRCRLARLAHRTVSLQADTTRAQAVSAVKEADILLLTSDSEASPLVILESMAAGTPWISFDVGCVRDHAGGLVVQSCGEMAAAAERILSDVKYRQELSEQGRSRVAECHSWAKIVSEYEFQYGTLSRARPAAGSSFLSSL